MKTVRLIILFCMFAAGVNAAVPVTIRTAEWSPDSKLDLPSFHRAGGGDEIGIRCCPEGLLIRAKSELREIRILSVGRKKIRQYLWTPQGETTGQKTRLLVFRDPVTPERYRTADTILACGVRIPWNRLYAMLPEKELFVAVNGTPYLLRMPPEYLAAKKKIEAGRKAEITANTFLKIPELVSYEEFLERQTAFVNEAATARLRQLRSKLAEGR